MFRGLARLVRVGSGGIERLRQERKLDLVALALVEQGDQGSTLRLDHRPSTRNPALPELVDLELEFLRWLSAGTEDGDADLGRGGGREVVSDGIRQVDRMVSFRIEHHLEEETADP